MKTLVTLLLLFFGAAPAFAAQMVTFGKYQIHYNAISTANLAPTVARNYQINRSKHRLLLTIAVLRRDEPKIAQAVPATVTANAVNMSDQLQTIDMREIKEGSAIYYIGVGRVTPPATLTFNVAITLKGEKTPHQVKFRHQFYK